jgi:autotransporter-associated beta strand protein
MPIEVEDEPTLCSENAWKYEAGPLTLPKGCVLTVDTSDPDTAEGYDCTFASVMSGPGSLKVKGAGSLALTAENSIGGAVVLDGGRLVLAQSQTLGALSGTGRLTLGDAAGGPVELNVSGAADFSGITLSCPAALEQAGRGWVTVVTVAPGSAVSGTPALPSGHWKSRIVADADGTRRLQVRLRPGIEIIVR